MIKNLLEDIKRLRALADTGLLYASSEYDKERYEEVKEISLRLLSTVSDVNIDELKLLLPKAKEYPTAKVDIRGILLSPEKKILLVKESMDGKWSLPGGWADVGYSPQEVVIKEFKEETGLDISVRQLLAVFDKRKHPHPPQAFYVYKMVFYCIAISTELNKGFDVLDAAYFDIDALPELSEDRILKSQIELLYQKVIDADTETFFE
jgi:ADP-ribose pyrophosphatase YjhB (NUDIX family)